MKYKIFIIASLAVMLALAGYARAESNEGVNVEKNNGSIKRVTTTVNQVQNGRENATTSDLSNKEVTSTEKEVNKTAEERRSDVANAVKQLLEVANRQGGIGEQVRLIAQSQNDDHQKIETSLENIKNRSGFVRFLIGPKYSEIKNAQKLLDQNKEKIQQLTQLKDKLANLADQQQVTQQIQLLEQTQSDAQNLVNDLQKGFSLFGWLVKQFVK
ncbi:MAG: hypothetical protein NTU97_04170 [Candidatus Magasanikbacteria bacterium]|nr:hypothetical protein [Candidatus Magasanikbacteria bacterium]